MKKRNSTIKTVLIVGLVSASIPFFVWSHEGAWSHGATGQRVLDRLDADGDGVVSYGEFGSKEGRMFSRLDENSNGSLSLDEFLTPKGRQHPDASEERKAKMEERKIERFANLDLNEDGAVTSEEMREFSFFKLDVDDDGVLSEQELNAVHAKGKRSRGGKHFQS